MENAWLVLTIVVIAPSLSVVKNTSSDQYCYPGSSCMPTYQEMLDLNNTLTGQIYFPTDNGYLDLTRMINTRVTRSPVVVVAVESTFDVVMAVDFANKFNLKISILSYIGRATGDGTLMINLKNMKGLKFDLSATASSLEGIVRAQSGNTWIRLYKETNKLGRVIVGGSSHTVSLGGFTLGGGHSPIGRKFRLGIDNLLEVEMVTANGSIAYANSNGTTMTNPLTGQKHVSSNTELFWAVRGGGGSTFGIVTTFTFKLHFGSKMVIMSCFSPVYNATGHNVGYDFVKKFYDLLSTSLAPEWGGYEVYDYKDNKKNGRKRLNYLLYESLWRMGFTVLQHHESVLSQINGQCHFTNVSSFLEYASTVIDFLYYKTYIFNVIMQSDSFTDTFYDFVFDMITGTHTNELSTSCTAVLIGGNISTVDPECTAMNPTFQSGVMSITCSLSWHEDEENSHVEHAEHLSAKLLRFGKGTYFNEPSSLLPDWKQAYWSGHYNKHLKVKIDWDPTNVFSCYHCVGSDDLKPDQVKLPDVMIG